MSIAQLDALYDAYVVAEDAADYDTAISCLRKLRALLAKTANISRSLAGGGSQSISFNGVNLDSAIADCRRAKAAAIHASAGLFQRTKVTYARADAVDA